MSQEVNSGLLTAVLREAWIDAENRRLSYDQPNHCDRPTIHSIVVEYVYVSPWHRRQGHCKRFLMELCADARFDMVVVEAVQNPILAEWLLREGWDCDPKVSDFYHTRRVTP
jgi:hypothetical protein